MEFSNTKIEYKLESDQVKKLLVDKGAEDLTSQVSKSKPSPNERDCQENEGEEANPPRKHLLTQVSKLEF